MKNAAKKLMIACLESDVWAVSIVHRMAEVFAKKAGQEYRWRHNEATCKIARIETEAPNQSPVFVLGGELTDLASLGDREGCGRDDRILIVSRDQSVVRPRNFSDLNERSPTYLSVDEAVLGFQRIILITGVAEYLAMPGFVNLTGGYVAYRLSEACASDRPNITGLPALFQRVVSSEPVRESVASV